MYAIQPSGHTSIGGSGGSNDPNSYMCLSVVTLLCINPLFGLIAVIFACSSKHVAAVDWDGARLRGRIAMWLSVTGIVISGIAALACILIFFTKDS